MSKFDPSVAQETIAEFCRRHHIVRLSFFGSVLREDFTEDSDIDVLVEFESGRAPGFFRLAAMEKEMSTLLNGRKVEIRTPRELSRYFRDEVIASAEVQYE